MVAPAGGHVDAGGADGHPDALRLVADGDGAKVGVELVPPRLLGADQLTVNGQTFDGGSVSDPSDMRKRAKGALYLFRCQKPGSGCGPVWSRC